MGPPRPRAGTLAGGRGGVGAGRGAGGAHRVGRHGWRMASLLATLPLPLPPVVAFSSTRHPQLRATVLSAISLEPPSNDALPSPPYLRASWALAVRAPLSFVFRELGLRAPLPFLGLRAAALSRARGPGLSLDRAVPFPLRAPSPVTRPPQPRDTRTGARAQSTSRWESAPQGFLSSYPLLWALLPQSPRSFHDVLSPLQASRSTSSIPHLAGTSRWELLSTHKKD